MASAVKDETVSEAFAERYVGMLNDAALILMTSIGHQTGLFDRMAELAPSTSAEIASAAGLNERYVREWLGAMVTGGFVVYDRDKKAYWLPPEHSAWLTRAAGIDNLALQAQYVPLMAQVEDEIVRSFREGGGVPYARYPRFQKLMAEESAAVHDAALLDVILPLVPGLMEALDAGIDAADIGCGSGHAVNIMAKRFPNSQFSGFDFSEEGIASATREAGELGLANARFEVRDVAELGIDARFDLVTAFDAIHDQAHPAKVLSGIAAALKPEGAFLMVDIAASSEVHENIEHPLGPFLYTISCMHCMTVSLALGGAGLGTVWGRQKAEKMLAKAGFVRVETKNVEGDLFNNYYVAQKT
jgi:2-polyprenyl-3-methyl-5-hydroxy-6-metoxy-1,4-benzoquinol methylase